MSRQDELNSEQHQSNQVSASRESTAVYGLLLAGAGLVGVMLLDVLVAFLPDLYRRPRLTLAALGSWQEVGAAYLVAVVVAFACYVVAWRLARRLRPTRGRLLLVAAVPALSGLLLLFAYPVFSHDVFYAISGGRIITEYNQNPFEVPPARFNQDPFFPYTDWRNLTMPYGPLWALVGAGISQVAGDGIVANVLAFKLLSFVSFGISTFVLGLILRDLHPERLLPGLVLWAWNPLILLETAGNAHNGIVMVMLLLLGLYFALRSRHLLAILVLTLAVALKYVAIILLPLVAVFLVRRHPSWLAKLRTLVPAGLVSLLVLGLLFMPFWSGWRTFGFLNETSVYYGSLPASGFFLLGEFQVVARDWWLRALTFLPAGLLYLWLLREAGTDTTRFLRACYLSLMMLLIIWPYFAPWYLLWIAAVAAILATGGPSRQVIGLSCAAALTYLFEFSLRKAFDFPVPFWSTLTAITVFGTMALVVGWSRVRDGRFPGPNNQWLAWRLRRSA